MSSPLLHWPSTPSPPLPSHSPFAPNRTSPLASPKSSPLMAAEARRRRAQYKSRTPSMPLPSRRTGGASRLSSSSTHTVAVSSLSMTPAEFQHQQQPHTRAPFHRHRRTSSAESPQKAFLRERFIARCLERVKSDRARAVQTRRRAKSCGLWSDGSSDGPDDVFMDYADADEEGEDDADDDDETVMQDELFRRIMENAQRRRQHDYRVSYTLEVGSSIDPDMEDVDRWERELREASSDPGFVPEDIDEEDLEDYAAMADIADLDEFADELFTWSDAEDDMLANHTTPPPSSSPSVALRFSESGVPTEGTDVDMS